MKQKVRDLNLTVPRPTYKGYVTGQDIIYMLKTNPHLDRAHHEVVGTLGNYVLKVRTLAPMFTATGILFMIPQILQWMFPEDLTPTTVPVVFLFIMGFIITAMCAFSIWLSLKVLRRLKNAGYNITELLTRRHFI